MERALNHASEEKQLSAAKRSAAARSVFGAAGITLLKLITGIMTGSLGMLSEAAHSGVDLMAAAITLFSVQLADKPADADHTYGHAKVESLSAFVETGLMAVSCVWIVLEAVRRLMGKAHLELRVSIWPVLVLLLSMLVDWLRSRELSRVAKSSGSQALEADALHFSTDIWSSFAVLLGLGASFAGKRWGIHALEYADPIAALCVSAIILAISWRLARQTVDALLDRTSPELRSSVENTVDNVSGVERVQRVRMRQAGTHTFADVTVGIARNLTLQQSEQIAQHVSDAVQNVVPHADVVVHTVPVESVQESIFDRVRAVGQRSGLTVHELSVQQYEDGLHVEQHLELPETTKLRYAHDVVTKLEADIRREVPDIVSIATHIESEDATIAKLETMHDRALQDALIAVAKHFPEVMDVHDILITRAHDRLQMVCHCSMPDDMSMGDVHRIISELEAKFRRERPEVARLLIHPEPVTDNRR